MISDPVQAIITEFQRTWRPVCAASPELALNLSWPSLGAIDQITYGLRLRAKPEPSHRNTLRGAAAYIGAVAEKTWAAMGAQALLDQSDDGIVLRAASGPGISDGSPVTLFIERELGTLLRNLPVPLTILTGFERSIPPDQPLIPGFALGILLGMSPVIGGSWSGASVESAQERADSAVRELARQSAEHYASAHPDEPLGQVAELYLNGLVFPPPLMLEDLPARGAVFGIHTYLTEFGIGRSAAARLTANLAASADELIGAAGFAATAAALSGPVPPELLIIGQSKGLYVPLLRQAMLDVRARGGMPDDWLTGAVPDGGRLDIELQLGFFPWLKLSAAKIRERRDMPGFRAFVEASSKLDFGAARDSIDRLSHLAPDDLDLHAQRLHLGLVSRDVDSVIAEGEPLAERPGGSDHAALLNVLGMAAIVMQDMDAAASSLGRARALRSDDPLLSAEIHHNYAWTCIAREAADEALRAIDDSLRHFPAYLPALLNRVGALYALGRKAEADRRAAELGRLAPLDRRVFAGLIHNAGLAGWVRSEDHRADAL